MKSVSVAFLKLIIDDLPRLLSGVEGVVCYTLSYALCLNSCCQYKVTDSDMQKEEAAVRLKLSSPVSMVPVSAEALCVALLGEAAASPFLWLSSVTAVLKLHSLS